MEEKKKQIERDRNVIINVIKKCKSEARNGVSSPPLSRPMERASALTGLPLRTLYRLQKEQRHPVRKAPKKHRMGKHSLDDFDKCVIRRTVADMYGDLSNSRENPDRVEGNYQFHW